ncbi:calmodulin-dependent protein kinase [Gigaspora margarita]|uniref:Calmodulin-dependent protein kinase n=1 Tax=Gigaspora margarita TaxID=4874 RepID=A0A8H4ADF0_GIGMA|nr:calmodulin-dependent protein kinase [Gigaspora margarita]
MKTRHLRIIKNLKRSKLLTEPVPIRKKESKVKRINVRQEDHQAPDGSQRSADMRNASRYRAGVNSEETKAVEVGIESQALLYGQRPVENVKAGHMSEMIEPSFEQRARSEEESSMDHRKTTEMDKVNKTKVDQKKEMKRENKNFSIKDLDEACKLWMKKVNKLKSMIKQDKEKEKRSNRHPTYFEKSLDGLDKILEVEPTNARALVNKENKEKTVNKNPSLTYLSKNKKEALADLKSDSNKTCKWYSKRVKEEKATVELNINSIENKCSKIEDLKDSHPENYGMRPAKEIRSNEGRLVDKNKAFNYHQKAADMGNINGMYSIGYCNQNGFGIEEDEHKALKYYKKSTDTVQARKK